MKGRLDVFLMRSNDEMSFAAQAIVQAYRRISFFSVCFLKTRCSSFFFHGKEDGE